MGLRTFTFGGKSSSAYSMFITEAATYNVPERAVEMIEIPGRNGHYALDQGRFENVEVTYHVVVHKDTNANFQTEMSDVRNWLASKVGYQRLTDDYNSNVYRMAIFKGGLETDGAYINGAEFDIVFECKPQRWLTSGETATAVANNGTLSNPTLFDASPLLEVKGYGNIDIGGQSIGIDNALIGEVVIADSLPLTNATATQTLDVSMLNSGDDIVVSNAKYTIAYTVTKPGDSYYIDSSTTSIHNTSNCSATMTTSGSHSKSATVNITCNTATFTKGTSGSFAPTAEYRVKYYSNGTGTTYSITATCTISYDGNDTLTYSCSLSTSISSLSISRKVQTDSIVGDSSKSALGDPLYIDSDIGECWNEDSGVPVSVNNAVTFGSELPTLPPGSTTITYDNTITSLKIAPRWWKI